MSTETTSAANRRTGTSPVDNGRTGTTTVDNRMTGTSPVECLGAGIPFVISKPKRIPANFEIQWCLQVLPEHQHVYTEAGIS